MNSPKTLLFYQLIVIIILFETIQIANSKKMELPTQNYKQIIINPILPGNCSHDSCSYHGVCIPASADEHRCFCDNPYQGSYCQSIGVSILGVGPNPIIFQNPEVLDPGTWLYYSIAVAVYPPVSLIANDVNIQMTSWGYDNNSDPGCTFMLNTYSSYWTSITEYDFENFNNSIVIGNGSIIVPGALIDLNSVVLSVTRMNGSLSYCDFTLEATANCGPCFHGICINGTGVCVCEDQYTGPSCNLKLEDIGLPWLIVVAISCFAIGLGTMGSICRIYYQSSLGKAYTVF